jgi:HEAT repeat protein/GTPase SAR1 family protein
MSKQARQRFFVLVKVALLGVSLPLAVTSHSWVQAGTRQNNSLEYAQAPAKSTPQPSQSATPQPSQSATPQPRQPATPQPSQSADAKKTSQPNEEKTQEESEKSEKEKEQKPSLVITAVALGVVLVLYVGVLRLRPLWLLWLPAELKIPKIGIIPEFKVPLPVLRVIKYRPRVLDAWVEKHIDTFRKKFLENETVIERKDYVPIPVRLDNREIRELTVDSLSETFKQEKRVRLLIWGEGGSGKTTLACQMAKWAMEKDDKSKRLTEHLMLPILIEQELDSKSGEGMKPLLEGIAGQIEDLIDSEQPISDELLEQLLRQRRILVIVDHLSEMSKETREKIPPHLRDFPANALVVTSRLEEKFQGIDTKIKTLRFDGEELVSFIKNYLEKLDKWTLFENDQEDFLQECSRLVRIVGDKKTITVLLGKLYAERMINAKEYPLVSERSLDNIPDLIVDHVEKLNREVERSTGENYHTLKEDAKVIAWKCLEQNHKPSHVERVAVVDALGEKKADTSLEYFEKKLNLINSGNKGDTLRFALDPLAEYLAGLYLVEDYYKDNEKSWRNFLARIKDKSGEREDIKGFLLAVRDCCLVKGSEAKVPSFVVEELGKLAGLDLEALRQEHLKRRIKLLISNLLAEEATVEDRRRAAEEIGKIGSAANFAASPLVKVLKDKDSSVRLSAAEAIGKLGNDSEPILQGLLTLLTDEDSHVCSSAASALGELNNASEPVVQGLLALLEDKNVNSDVRSNVAEALVKLGRVSAPVQQRLLALLEDKNVNYSVRSRAAEVLVKLGNTSEPVQQGLLALFEDRNADSWVRSRAAEALGKLGNISEPVQQGLLALFEDEKADSWARSKAAEVLGKLSNASDFVQQGLLTLLKDKNVNSAVRCSAAQALVNLGNTSEPLQQGLLALLEDTNLFVRQRVGEALQELRQKLRNPSF